MTKNERASATRLERLVLSSADGVLNVNKPLRLSSAKALYIIRGRTGIRKSGHAGTLDPMATGVLLICMGKATKLVERIMGLEKAYDATARFDVTNAGHDTEMPFEPVDVGEVPDREAIEASARAFVGTIAQTPPEYSAVKIKGRPAYEYALKGKPLDIKPRPVVIHELTVHEYEWPSVRFTLRCGRGTYVRSLIRDWGAQFGAGGCLTSLVRTRVGPFRVEAGYDPDASPPEVIQSAFHELATLDELLAGP